MLEVLEARRGGAALPARAVLVTFDDAYRDFREHAWPVLKGLGIPATLFVPTAYPGQPDLVFWWDRIWAAVMLGPDRAALAAHLGTSLGADADRRRTATQLIEDHKRLPLEKAEDQLIGLERVAGVESARSSVLDWNELRDLSRRGVFLAPHTRSHPVLTRVSDGRLEDEIKGSIDDLARRVPEATPGVAFAFPTGRYDERALAVLRRLRVELAFTTERGTNRLGVTDPLRMRRVNVGLRADAHLIRLQVVLDTLKRRVVHD
jgi:peptidoglycan/xylan/chitin deacetylase (PgdA/CDA1 family)